MIFPTLIISATAFLSAEALKIDTSSKDSICSAASKALYGLLDYYEGNKTDGTIGYFAGDYYWWEYAELFHALIDYSYYCDDDQYDSLIKEGIESQFGSDYNFIPSLQENNIGNDDQTFWGLLAINAHLHGISDPDSKTWLEVAENVFDEVHERWDPDTCGGGVRWQILKSKKGYGYKNSITNGNLFLMASQLYDITGEEHYYAVAEKIWKWVTKVGFVKDNSDGILSVNDGANVDGNCDDLSYAEWSYNYGTYLGGLSYLYATTEHNTTLHANWSNSTLEMLTGVETFFNDDDIMYERTCQLTSTCNEDERCFKSILTRNMAQLLSLHHQSYDTIHDYLVASAKGAAQSCSGGRDGVTCGLNWYHKGWDGEYGIGEQMNALAIFVSLLV